MLASINAPATVADAVDRFLVEVLPHKTLCAGRRRSWIRLLKEAAASELGALPVDDADHSAVAALLLKRWRTTPVLAEHQRARLQAVFDYAIVMKWRTSENPARWKGGLAFLMPKLPYETEHMACAPWTRAPEVYKALASMKSSRAAYALRFCALTALRPGVVRAIEPEWIKGDVLSVPAEAMKMKKAFRCPLTEEALELYRSASFRMSSVAHAKPFRTLGLTDDEGRVLTAHGWRSTFRTWVADVRPRDGELAEHQLAHVVGGAVYRSYQRSDMCEQRRPLMEAWASHLTGDAVCRTTREGTECATDHA
jgi:integrase